MFATYIRIYLNLFLLRIGPQKIPPSKVLFWLTLATLIGGGLVLGSYHYSVEKNIIVNLFDVAFLTLFLALILKFRGCSNRFLQTATATFGIYSCFYVVHISLVFLMTGGLLATDHPILIIPSLLQLVLFIYGIVVFGHILQHAISTSKGSGLLLSVIYYIVCFVLIETLFTLPKQ